MLLKVRVLSDSVDGAAYIHSRARQHILVAALRVRLCKAKKNKMFLFKKKEEPKAAPTPKKNVQDVIKEQKETITQLQKKQEFIGKRIEQQENEAREKALLVARAVFPEIRMAE